MPTSKEMIRIRADREKVKSFVREPRVIGADICPGCMRPKLWSHKPFCDRFCEELWRRDQARRARNHLPHTPARSSFFVASAIEEVLGSAGELTARETAQYEPRW